MPPLSAKIKPALLWAAAFFLLIVCSLFSKEAAASVGIGIRLCIEQLIPSLFLFLVVSGLFPTGSGGRKRRFSPFPSGIAGMLFLAFTGGFPVGAMTVKRAAEDGRINLSEAKRLACCLVGCGPGFLISFVGEGLCGSRLTGVWMLLSQTLSGILLTIAVLLFQKKDAARLKKHIAAPAPKPRGSALVSSIQSAVRAMASICGAVIFFFGIRGVLERWLAFLPDAACEIVFAFLEVTSGCSGLKAVSGELRLILLSFFCSFGGICVHLQLYSILGKYAPKYAVFLTLRLLHASLSAGIFSLCCRVFPQMSAACFTVEHSISPQSSSPSPIIFVLLMLTTLLFCASCNAVFRGEAP